MKTTRRNPNDDQRSACSSSLAHGSVELPVKDGYYWLKNIGDEGSAIWRIVNVSNRPNAERRGMQRIARDCVCVLTKEDLCKWTGVEFVGPLLPPNDPPSPPCVTEWVTPTKKLFILLYLSIIPTVLWPIDKMWYWWKGFPWNSNSPNDPPND